MPEDPPTLREEIRDYILDMLAQLATLARHNGEVRIALLLDAVLSDDTMAPRKR